MVTNKECRFPDKQPKQNKIKIPYLTKTHNRTLINKPARALRKR